MLWIVKSTLVALSAGVGTFVPLKLISKYGVTSKSINSDKVVKVEDYKPTKHHQALSKLVKDGCKQVVNPKNLTWFGALYICKGKDNVAEFYFLDLNKESSSRVGESLAKKVSSIDYVKESDSEAHLILELNNGQKVNWSVVVDSGWKNFKNVSPESQCKVETLLLGGVALNCKFSDGTSYIYSVI